MNNFLDDFTLNEINFNDIDTLKYYYSLYKFEPLLLDNKYTSEKTLNNFIYIKISNKLGKLDELFNDIKIRIDKKEIPYINHVVFLMYCLCEKEINDKILNALKKYNYYTDLVYNVITYDNSIKYNTTYRYYINYFNLIKTINFNKEQINNIIYHLKCKNIHNFQDFFDLYKEKLYVPTFIKVIDTIKFDNQKYLMDIFISVVKKNIYCDLDIYNMCSKILDDEIKYYFLKKILDSNLIKNIDIFFQDINDNMYISNETILNDILTLFVNNCVNYEFLKTHNLYGFGDFLYSDMYTYMNTVNRKNKLIKLVQQ